MTRYLIIDDEAIAHEIIRGYCDKIPDFQLAKSCYDAVEALAFLGSNTVDLIFLDLNMPMLKGFDFLRTLSHTPKVIVTTAYAEHALEGFEMNVVDYLLKPFGFERFLKAVNKVMTEVPERVPTTESSEEPLFFKVKGKHVQLRPREICYVESVGNYCKIVTLSREFSLRTSLTDLLQLLSGRGLLQVHKSFAVSLEKVDVIEGNRMRIGSTTIPVGRTYKLRVQDVLKKQKRLDF